MATPIRMTAQWFVHQLEAGPVVAALNAIMVETRVEPGCLGTALSTEMGGLVLVRCHEDWRTEEDMKRHIRSERFSRLAAIMERGIEAPVVDFLLPDGVRGLEYADAVRREMGEPR